LGINDVTLARNANYWRRQNHKIAAHRRRPTVAVVNDDDLASVRPTPVAAEQAAGLIGHCIDARAVRALEHGNCIGAMPLDMGVARLPAEAIGLVVANDGASVFADDNAAGLLDQDAVALAHLAAGAAYVIETSGGVLRWRRHKRALGLCSGRPGWRSRGLQGRRSNCGGADRLLWGDRAGRLSGRDGLALPRRLRAWRRLHMTLLRRRLGARRRLHLLLRRCGRLLRRRLHAGRRLHLTLLWQPRRLRGRRRLLPRWMRARRWLHLTLLRRPWRLPRWLRARRWLYLTLLRRPWRLSRWLRAGRWLHPTLLWRPRRLSRWLLSGRWLHLTLLRRTRRLSRLLLAGRWLHLTLLRRRWRLFRWRLHLTLLTWRHLLWPRFRFLLLRLWSLWLTGSLRRLLFFVGLRRGLRHNIACVERRGVDRTHQNCRQYRPGQETFFCVQH
jgi:hypothetical protein